jgi:hypothetical protein
LASNFPILSKSLVGVASFGDDFFLARRGAASLEQLAPITTTERLTASDKAKEERK